jgi:hypothetical protein
MVLYCDGSVLDSEVLIPGVSGLGMAVRDNIFKKLDRLDL